MLLSVFMRRKIRVQTDKGLQKGIITIEKVSKAGISYTLLMYPPEVQKEIVNFFIR